MISSDRPLSDSEPTARPDNIRHLSEIGPNPIWSRHKATAALGVACLTAVVGVGLIYIGWRSDESPVDPRAAAPTVASAAVGQDPQVAEPLHGEFVVSEYGGYVTRLTQTGKVTAVAGDAITVRSVDGFTHSYVVTAGTTVRTNRAKTGIAAIAVGDTATVRATETRGGATATVVVEGPGPATG